MQFDSGLFATHNAKYATHGAVFATLFLNFVFLNFVSQTLATMQLRIGRKLATLCASFDSNGKFCFKIYACESWTLLLGNDFWRNAN